MNTFVSNWRSVCHRWERKCVDTPCDPTAALLTRRLAKEMVSAVDSASCWHLSLSAVAFSNLAVSLARFSSRCCKATNTERNWQLLKCIKNHQSRWTKTTKVRLWKKPGNVWKVGKTYQSLHYGFIWHMEAISTRTNRINRWRGTQVQ